MTSMLECSDCHVALNTGAYQCQETGCPAAKSIKKRQIKPVDPAYARMINVRTRAIKRGLDFDLTPEWIEETLQQQCIYCLQYEMPQLDRKDNAKGYTMDNVVPACKRCNTIKNQYLTFDEMIAVAELLGWREIQSGNIMDDINQ